MECASTSATTAAARGVYPCRPAQFVHSKGSASSGLDSGWHPSMLPPVQAVHHMWRPAVVFT